MRLALATVGTLGDVRPFAALAGALTARGHEVTAVAWELHRAAFAQSGARFEPAGPPTADDEIRRTAAEAARQRSPLAEVTVLRRFHLRDAAEHYAALCRLLAGHDLVLLHGIHALAAAAVADGGLRHATAVFDPVLLPTATAPPAGMPHLGPLNRVLWRALDHALRVEDRALAAALRGAGSPSADAKPRMFRARSPLLHLVAVSPTLAPPPPDVPPSVHFTGAWVTRRPAGSLPDFVERFLSSGAPPLLATFGSMADDRDGLIGRVVDAARSIGLRVIVQDAGEPSVAERDGVLRVGTLDHRALLPNVAAIVHHGGAGTTHAAARAGIPQLVIPRVGDQRFWAERVRQLGIGPSALQARRATPARLVDRLRRLTDEPAHRTAARRVAERMAHEDGLARAVGLLEAAVDGTNRAAY
ncbi:MAG TPA: glycosyltransferase [Candidatus Limnocylindria bacterium]|nr:glycosyltransferase [Candidatus Limnocylindria bacterium]